jgi:hypothetical protein
MAKSGDHMIFREAIPVLEAAGARAESRSFGVEGQVSSGGQEFRFQMHRASAGGVEMNVWREGDRYHWYVCSGVRELVDLLLAALQRVRSGRASDLQQALTELCPEPDDDEGSA